MSMKPISTGCLRKNAKTDEVENDNATFDITSMILNSVQTAA